MAVKIGRRPPPQAARSGLDGREHGAMLDRAGGLLTRPAGVMVLSAVWISRNLASGRLAPLCPERGQLDRERRNEGLGVTTPRPGWGRVSAVAGGTRVESLRRCCGLAPTVFAAVAPNPVHDDRQLAGDRDLGAAHADSLGEN